VRHRLGAGGAGAAVSAAGLRCGDVMTNGYDLRPEYGSDALWPNVVWTIIGILCACGLVAFPFIG